ncbi:S-layer homology domain-containing protein [Brevibacillus centrosporus]|uniref:S-layer homology domain-containing protein n=1 Tax=Brevibacillus centrosporus TaxID=54910 RepID=UPI00147752CC|nr:S-layer homology domain-containing protein [Brevibacillus centrosporus]MEC2129343.1 S-layer homology domain-containing protein [Brevibacillus centrosporus]
MIKRVSVFLSTALILSSFILIFAGSAYGQAGVSKGLVQSDYESHQFKEDIEFVIGKRVMWKYTDGTFRPTVQMTQGQLLTSLVTLMQLKEKAHLAQMSDGHWGKDIYEKANKAGMLTGVTIDPNRLLSKEEAALIINNAWLPYRGGVTPGVSNYKHLINRGFLPIVSYTSESPFQRAEAAHILKLLYLEFHGMIAGGKVADQFHNSLKLENGYLSGTVPDSDNLTITAIIIKDSASLYLNVHQGFTFREKKSDIEGMILLVEVPEISAPVAHYTYPALPKLTRINALKFD